MKNKKSLRRAILSLFLIIFVFGSYFYSKAYSQTSRYIGKSIERIDFIGNKFVKNEELLNKITFKLGETLDEKKLNQSIKNIFETGYFKKVWVEAALGKEKDTVALRFQMIENPFVRRINMKGNMDLGEADIRDAIALREKEVYTENKEIDSIKTLLQRYKEKGLMNAFVKIKKSKINKTTNTLDIDIIIDEGEKIRISKINIIGNQKLKSKTILAKLQLKENVLFKDGEFREDKFAMDKENIINIYKEKGYLDAVLKEASWEIRWKNPIKKDKRVIVITYKVEEGEQSYFAGYHLDWDKNYLNKETEKPLFTKKKMQSYFGFTNNFAGKLFNNTIHKNDISMINYLYSQKGYIFARVIPQRTSFAFTKEEIDRLANSPEQKENENEDYYNIAFLKKVYEKKPQLHGKNFVHTALVIAEGDKGYLENIIIKGNTKTKDYVIRREVLMKEGEIFNGELVQRSREKIYNLGFFKAVNIDVRPGSNEGLMNLIIEVEEQPTGTISLGGGYGTASGFSIFAELGENNLKGTGQAIRGKFEFGPQKLVIEGSWTLPWLGKVPLALTLSAFYAHSKVPAYSIAGLKNTKEAAYYIEDTIGFGVGISHSFATNWGHYHRIAPLFNKISNPSSMVDDEVYHLVKQGWNFKHVLTNGIFFDNRDNIFNTTKGVHFDFSIDLVGSIMGGSSHYMRYNPIAEFFWWPMDFTFFNAIRNNMLRRWRIVFHHRISTSFTHLLAPVYNKQDPKQNPYLKQSDRLKIGGYETLRGWDLHDNNFPLAWQDGGSHMIMFSNELRIPLEPNIIWFVFYFDIGALFDDPKEYQLDRLPSDLAESILDSQLTAKNLFSGAYYRYSWGFGVRLQIPILPLRLYFGQRLAWNSAKKILAPPKGAKDFNFVLGIGDKRF